MHRHTGHAFGMTVCCRIGFPCRIPGALNSKRYISKVLELVGIPYIQRLSSVVFQQNNVGPHGKRNPRSVYSSKLSPIESTWPILV
ncbi:hypothetical protein TNCV_3679101 [Trichonephila clavipes]|nr:hypothetical protein TNCV_3679101 [Trichonephila clavipes]